MAMLKLKKLDKHFEGVKAVNDLSFEIPAAKVTAIIGPNGSGKTTLVNLLSGLIRLDGGQVTIDDTVTLEVIRPYDISTYGITRTFQDVRLFNQMSVLDNLLLTLTDRTISGALFERHGQYHLNKAESLLKKVGLWEKREAQAGDMSYGQRKLLEIARALAMEAKIYLFDEPFAGLFPQMVDTVTRVIEELREHGKTIILIEHNMDIIRHLADYLVVLDSGKLLADGKPNEVLKRPEVIEAYLGD